MRLTRLFALLALLVACGCGSGRTVILKLQGDVPDAIVTINDRYVGKLSALSRRGIALPPGQYTLTVEQAGYFPFDQLVQIDEQPVVLQVRLVPIPD